MNEFVTNIVGEMLPAAVVVVVDLVAVIVAVGVDFVSGIVKARRQGVATSSRGFRRSVTKLVNYLLLLFGMLTIDGIIVLTMLLSRMAGGWNVVMIPWLTSAAAVSLTFIEAKSISENVGTGNPLADLGHILGHLRNLKKLLNNF
ncbi:MAG: phage holin family protein [Muribaculaceae bacterium]|nr:phage holin family protein [Muribaculaceae bacterium]